MTNVTATTLGENAYKVGHSIYTNPFRDGTDEAKQFASAWKKTHKKVSETAMRDYKEGKRTFRNKFNS
jgi:hypothetical protein